MRKSVRLETKYSTLAEAERAFRGFLIFIGDVAKAMVVQNIPQDFPHIGEFLRFFIDVELSISKARSQKKQAQVNAMEELSSLMCKALIDEIDGGSDKIGMPDPESKSME